MAKKKVLPKQNPTTQEGHSTLRDLLSSDVLERLKAQAEELKQLEEKKKEENRKQAEVIRRAEQKRLENDFEYLLKNSDLDWRKFK